MAGASSAFAQSDWPSKPVHILTPQSAGGIWDLVARKDGEFFEKKFGQPVIVENHPGAGGELEAKICAEATPDGYTFCAVNHNILVLNPMQKGDKLTYDPADLVPITQSVILGHGVVINPKLPINNIQEWKDYAKAHPGDLNFGTLGQGSGSERQMFWLEERWGIDMTPVAYKGAQEISAAIASGELDLTMLGLGNFVGAIQDGQLRLIAVDSPVGRSPTFPDVEAMGEHGDAFVLSSFGGYAWPKDVPEEIQAKLEEFFKELADDPEHKAFLDTLFVGSAYQGREHFEQILAEQDAAGKEFYAQKTN
jgi:tripartite-type tricarboxylate transporter receptor subunit TctC